jgi:hypothetical protein
VGRQKIPVVRTQAKNSPSNDWSRSMSARYISVVEGSVIMGLRIGRCGYCALPGFGRAIRAGSQSRFAVGGWRFDLRELSANRELPTADYL